MQNSKTNSVTSIVAPLIVAASLFCALFGQGAHLHVFDIHIGNHFDIHAHVHAHESHEEPLQTGQNQEKNKHQHEVSTASDIIGTLTIPLQLDPDLQSYVVLTGIPASASNVINPRLQQSPTLFALPPPRPGSNQYHLFSLSRRGPPIA